MKPLVALGATVLAVSLLAPIARRSSADSDCENLPDSGGWVLFADSNRRVPDFWLQDSLVVQEIAVCRNGISFLFIATDEGSLYWVALVFLNPLGPLWSSLAKGPWIDRGDDYFRERYSHLLASLQQVAGEAIEEGQLLDFRMIRAEQRPRIIDPARRLLLRWKGNEIQLRGDLDVYLNAFS